MTIHQPHNNTTSTTTSDLGVMRELSVVRFSKTMVVNDDYITSGGADKIYGGAGDDRIEITGDAGGGAVEVIGGTRYQCIGRFYWCS